MISGKRLLIRLLTLTLGGFLFSACVASAQKSLYQHSYPKHNGTRISLTSPFDKGPTHGFQPVQVTLKNNTSRDRKWNLRFEYSSILKTSSTFQIKVKAGQEITQDILVPVPWHLKHSTNRQENIYIQSVGLPPLTNYNSEQFQNDWPQIIISEKLAARNLTLLSNYLKDQKGAKKNA